MKGFDGSATAFRRKNADFEGVVNRAYRDVGLLWRYRMNKSGIVIRERCSKEEAIEVLALQAKLIELRRRIEAETP